MFLILIEQSRINYFTDILFLSQSRCVHCNHIWLSSSSLLKESKIETHTEHETRKKKQKNAIIELVRIDIGAHRRLHFLLMELVLLLYYNSNQI